MDLQSECYYRNGVLIKKTEKNVTITVNKEEQTLPAVYEGSVDEEDT